MFYINTSLKHPQPCATPVCNNPNADVAPTGAGCVPDHREGEGRIFQRDLPLHQGQAAHPVRGRAPGPPGERLRIPFLIFLKKKMPHRHLRACPAAGCTP